MEVASCIDGRLRIRDEQLKEPSIAETVRRNLRLLPEVKSVRTNPRTGSLLVIYDKVRTTIGRILSAVAGFFGFSREDRPATGAASGKARPYLTTRRAVNLGMLASLVVSLGGVMAGAEALHIAVGLLFVALVGIHVSGRWRPLFT